MFLSAWDVGSHDWASALPPSAPPPNAPSAGSFAPLATALAQCLFLIALGAVCRAGRLFLESEVTGLSAFVGRLSLPALLYLSLATLDVDRIDWPLLAAVSISKLVLFALVLIACAVVAAGEWQGSKRWMLPAGLNGIFATQSNDFALGLPLISAIWGDRYTHILFLVAPIQFAVINPISFAMMEAARSDGRGRSGVLRRLVRSPPVAATAAGLATRLVLRMCGADAQLPAPLLTALSPLRDAFTASALVTLGLSLVPSLGALREAKVMTLCVVCAKLLVLPALMRLVGTALLPAAAGPSLAFCFLYGMLPSAPTALVFAREYGADSNLYAAMQLLGLLASIPLLLASAYAVEAPPLNAAELSSYSATTAALGVGLGLYFVASLGASMCSARPGAREDWASRGWLLAIGIAALGLDCAALLDVGLGCARDAGLRSFSAWATGSARGCLTLLSCLMAHQACPERARRCAASAAAAAQLRRRQIAAGVAAVLLPAVAECIGWLSGAQPGVGPSEQTCGGQAPRALRMAYIAYDAVLLLVTVVPLVLVWLAPAPELGTCPISRRPVGPSAEPSPLQPSRSGPPAGPSPCPPTDECRERCCEDAPSRAEPLLSDWPSAQRVPLIRLWRTRLCLLQLWSCLSLLLSISVELASLSEVDDTIGLVLLLLDRCLIFLLPLALVALFGFTPEVTWRLRRFVRACWAHGGAAESSPGQGAVWM